MRRILMEMSEKYILSDLKNPGRGGIVSPFLQTIQETVR